MLKIKQSVSNLFQTYDVNEFGSNTFSINIRVLIRKICDIKVNSNKNFNVSQHNQKWTNISKATVDMNIKYIKGHG